MALTPEQQAALDRVRGKSAVFGNAPSQRMRTVAQGVSLNTADELEAALISAATGRPKEEVAQEIRQKIENYKAQSPNEAMALEFMGAVAPSAILSAVTRSPAPMTGVFTQFFPNLAKVIGLGGVEGAVQTVGAMEQPVSERLEEPMQIATGAALGAGTGGATFAGTAGALKGADILSESLRFVSGSRARNAVTNEVQRIAEEAGITPDEAMARIFRGELIAEDPNVALALRPFMGSGEASTLLRGEFARRPTQTGADTSRPATTRREARNIIRSGLAAGLDRNIYRQMRADATLSRQLENKAYGEAFANVQDAPQEVVDQMYEAIARFPSGGNQLKNAFKSETGRDPFFTIDDKGVVSFRMLPTMRDAEQLRRIIADESRSLQRSGGANATVGVNLGAAERSLRDSIDLASPELASAREQARLVRARRENYQAGKTSNTRSADEVEVEFSDILKSKDPGLIQAYRMGYLERLNAQIEGGNKASVVARLTDPESKEGRIFRIIYPSNMQDAALERLGVARQSQMAANTLLGGSSTAPTLEASKRTGVISGAVGTGRLAADALAGDMGAAANVLDRIVSQFAPSLTSSQKAQVAKILISQDPQIVRKALTDREVLKSLQSSIISLAGAPTMTAALAGTTLAPNMGE